MAEREKKQDSRRRSNEENDSNKINTGPSVKGYPPGSSNDKGSDTRRSERKWSGSEGSGRIADVAAITDQYILPLSAC